MLKSVGAGAFDLTHCFIYIVVFWSVLLGVGQFLFAGHCKKRGTKPPETPRPMKAAAHTHRTDRTPTDARDRE